MSSRRPEKEEINKQDRKTGRGSQHNSEEDIWQSDDHNCLSIRNHFSQDLECEHFVDQDYQLHLIGDHTLMYLYPELIVFFSWFIVT